MWFRDLLNPDGEGPTFHVYLLGLLDYRDGLRLQRRLVEEVATHRHQASLIVCEHPPFVSVGREGDHQNVLLDREDFIEQGWGVQWVNRGGGCFLHTPGQLAIYPIFPLRDLGLGLYDYLERLHRVLIAVLDDFSVHAVARPTQQGVWVGQRIIANVGVAVSNWVSHQGAFLNVTPDLLPMRDFRVSHATPMTSLARERHGAPRMAHVRQQLIEHFQQTFGLGRTTLLFSHPSVSCERVEEVVGV